MTRPLDDERRDSGAPPVTPEPEPTEQQEAPSAERQEAPSAERQEAPGAEEQQAASAEEQPERAAAPEQPGEPADAAEHEHQLERDLDELTAKAQKADEYLELAQRTRADFENYRKRAAREAAAAQERGVVKLVRELLPAVDNLDRALEALVNSEPAVNGDDFVSGIKLVHAELIAALARAGVERFDPEGERFDPERHEALGQQPVEGAESGTIVEVYQRGYRLGDSVIRPARVLVAG